MTEKKRNYTELQLKFLDVLMGEECEGDIRKAMRIAGYSDTTPISAVINSLYEEIIEAAKKVIASNTMRATMATIDVMKKPGELGAQHKLKAAQHILDRAGVKTKDESTDVNLKVPQGGLFILPAKSVDKETVTDDEEKTDG